VCKAPSSCKGCLSNFVAIGVDLEGGRQGGGATRMSYKCQPVFKRLTGLTAEMRARTCLQHTTPCWGQNPNGSPRLVFTPLLLLDGPGLL
jgi:hypothetical protein